MPNADQLSALERLAKLRESGTLSEEEFAAQKTAIFASISSSTASHVPFYRKLWVVVSLTCLLLTFPIALLILVTGGVYRRSKDRSFVPIKNTTRYIYTSVLGLSLAAVVIGVASSPESISQNGAESADTDKGGQPTSQTATSSSGVGTASGGDDWTLTVVSNPLDGAAFAATKSFQFPAQKSRIDVSLTCTLKTRDVKIKIESYNDTPENGANAGSPLVTLMGPNGPIPIGRVKVGTDEVAVISQNFSIDNYSNVISWDVLISAQLAYDTHRDPDFKNLAAGNFLRTGLPMVIEIQNEGGTEQFTIPKDSNSVIDVIEKCSARDLPAFNGAASTPEPAPAPAGPAQESAPSPNANTQDSSTTDSQQPGSP